MCLFATSEPAYATGIGEILQPITNDLAHLKGLYLFIVKPPVAISTAQAFSFITPKAPTENCLDIVKRPVTEWRNHLSNDFEHSIFSVYPEIRSVKQSLYDMGAFYAQMSGSGSAFFALLLLPQPNSLLPSKNGLHSVAPYNIATTKRQLAAWGQVSKFAYYSKMISKNLFYH